MPRWSESDLRAYEQRTNQAGRAVSHTEQPQCPKTLATGGGRETQSSGCVQVCFTLYRVRLLDVDAKYTSIKDLLDCLTNSGLIPGDKEGQIGLEVRQVKVKTKLEEKTEIILTVESITPTHDFTGHHD